MDMGKKRNIFTLIWMGCAYISIMITFFFKDAEMVGFVFAVIGLTTLTIAIIHEGLFQYKIRKSQN